MKRLIFKIALIAAFGLMLSACGGKPAASTAPAGSTNVTPAATNSPFVPISLRIGDVAPDFKLPDANGRIVTISQYKGRPIFINVWSFT